MFDSSFGFLNFVSFEFVFFFVGVSVLGSFVMLFSCFYDYFRLSVVQLTVVIAER